MRRRDASENKIRSKQVELGIHPYSAAFQQKHHELVMSHNKMVRGISVPRSWHSLWRICLEPADENVFRNVLNVLNILKMCQ